MRPYWELTENLLRFCWDSGLPHYLYPWRRICTVLHPCESCLQWPMTDFSQTKLARMIRNWSKGRAGHLWTTQSCTWKVAFFHENSTLFLHFILCKIAAKATMEFFGSAQNGIMLGVWVFIEVNRFFQARIICQKRGTIAVMSCDAIFQGRNRRSKNRKHYQHLHGSHLTGAFLRGFF